MAAIGVVWQQSVEDNGGSEQLLGMIQQCEACSSPMVPVLLNFLLLLVLPTPQKSMQLQLNFW
jgi:hypothetical protein